MSLYLKLFWEFFKVGLFAVGGGMATLPFLKEIGTATGWYTYTELMNMLAVSESTPGPIGINMATYVGFTVGGVPGAVIATLGEVTPSIIVILIVAAMLKKFRDSRLVANAFYGLRPASTGLIGAACVTVVLEVLDQHHRPIPVRKSAEHLPTGAGHRAAECAGAAAGGGAAGADKLGKAHEKPAAHRFHPVLRLGGYYRKITASAQNRRPTQCQAAVLRFLI
ncbi:MAG: chromate transporter [Oscillospiraceae bacterium]